MSFSSFKENKLLFENFRKFVNEEIVPEDEPPLEIQPEPERTTYGSQEEYSSASKAEQTAQDKAAEARAILDAERESKADVTQPAIDVMGGISPDDEGSTSIETSGPDALTRAGQAYAQARREGLGMGEVDEHTGIQVALLNLQDTDTDAYNELMSKVQQGEDGKYSFKEQEKPTDF